MTGIEGKNVLVTGASTGIGQARAVRLGYEAAGGEVALIRADVSDDNAVAHMMTTAVEELDGIDILVNNAGLQIGGDSHELSLDEFDAVLGVNLRGAWLCARQVIRHFLDREKGINRSWVEGREKKEMVERHIPMGRAGQAEEMTDAAAFLCSDEATYITGQTLFIDGGLTLFPDFRTPWSSE